MSAVLTDPISVAIAGLVESARTRRCCRCKERKSIKDHFAPTGKRCRPCQTAYAAERRALLAQGLIEPKTRQTSWRTQEHKLSPQADALRAFLALSHTPGADGNAPARLD